MQRQSIYQDDKIEVRPLQPGEASALLEAVRSSRAEIGRWESWCVESYDLDDATAFLRANETQWHEGIAYDFNVLSRSSGLVLGSAAVNQIDRENQRGNVGYWTRTEYAGRGIATFAAALVSRFAISRLGLTRLEIVAQVNNLPSQRVAEKIGATFECVARNRIIYHGEPRDAKVYSLIPEDISA